MAVAFLLAIAAIVLLGAGVIKQSAPAIVVGSVLLANAFALYLIFGPVARLGRSLFRLPG